MLMRTQALTFVQRVNVLQLGSPDALVVAVQMMTPVANLVMVTSIAINRVRVIVMITVIAIARILITININFGIIDIFIRIFRDDARRKTNSLNIASHFFTCGRFVY